MWGFYGRSQELLEMRRIFRRDRWFFARVTGRRRIGKTTLIQQALEGLSERPIFYLQVPDSAPAGVLSQVLDALELFQIDPQQFPKPTSLGGLARLIGSMARAGYVVALDEFQYFNRDRLRDFCSLLQTEVDQLQSNADQIRGGLVVLGSIHTEMSALLENRGAPLYNRTTDEIDLGHLDIASLLEILRTHSSPTPERLLFLWALFEGVHKFYRDCFEQGVLAASRQELLSRIFFSSSSPLKNEAENWFLKELHGRYDVILKFVARNPGCSHAELAEHVRQVSPDTSEQVGGYLQGLIDKYGLIERRLPVFAKPTARRGRYYLTDNFLRSWLSALAGPASMVSFRPLPDVVSLADQRMRDVEGPVFEKLVATLYEERSRRSVGDFPISDRIKGYWDSRDTEIDLVAFSEDTGRIRFGTCKRSGEKLLSTLAAFEQHVERFLTTFPKLRQLKPERVALAPSLDKAHRAHLIARGFIAEDLGDLTLGL
jgi:AAA+ ATPase superfamily predicted ATPase